MDETEVAVAVAAGDTGIVQAVDRMHRMIEHL